jgi:hypothetical protein
MREAEDFGETSEDCRKIVWTSPRSPSESAPVGLCQQIGRFRKNVGRFSVDSCRSISGFGRSITGRFYDIARRPPFPWISSSPSYHSMALATPHEPEGASFNAPDFSKAATLSSHEPQGTSDEKRISRETSATNGSGFPPTVSASKQPR